MSSVTLDPNLTNPLRPVYLFMGDADWLIEQAVQQVESAGLKKCGLPAFNHGSWRSSDGTAGAALSAARTVPMMADLRVVVVRELQKADATVLQAMLDYVKSPVPSTVLILAGGTFPKPKKGGTNWATRLRNAAKKTGVFQKFAVKDISPAAFVRDTASRLDKRLDRSAVDMLVEIVGTDLGRLAQEMEKVSLYVGDRKEVTGDDIAEACSMVAEAVVWDLTTGISTGDTDSALTALYRLLEVDDSPHRPLALIAWQLRQILQVVEQLRAGRSAWDIQRSTRVRRDVLDRLVRVTGPDFPGPEQIFERLAKANRLMNSHPAGGRRILEALVVDLCGLVPTPAR